MRSEGNKLQTRARLLTFSSVEFCFKVPESALLPAEMLYQSELFPMRWCAGELWEGVGLTAGHANRQSKRIG